MLRLDGVGVQFRERTTLQGITLSVGAGELVALTGARGAGKTLLLAIAAGRRLPTSGAVWLGGRNIVALQRASWPYVRRNIAYLSPSPALIDDDDATENVMLALAVAAVPLRAARAKAGASLARLGIDTDLAARAVGTLSTAERHLVVVARQLALAAPALVLDDPLIGLEASDRERVLRALAEEQRRGAAILSATADQACAQALAEQGARQLRLEHGRLAPSVPVMTLVSASAARATSASTAEQPESSARARRG